MTSLKMRSDDRILVLTPIDGMKAKSSTGLIDPRVFTGENNLHAIRDPMTTLWYLKYNSGIVPQVLKQQFTSFERLIRFTEGYFKRRNLKIVEVKD